ncbi:MAG: hypothetical protein AAGK00_01525 [Pseudomonadota bacterium]
MLRAVFAVALLCVSACQHYGTIAERSLTFNEQVASATNKVLLLNIVRASFRERLEFSGISSGSAGAQFDGTLTFGAAALKDFLQSTTNLNAQLNVKDPRPSFDLEVNNTQDFMQGLARQIDVTTLQLLLESGFPPELVFTLLVDSISVSLETDGGKKIDFRCRNSPRIRRIDRVCDGFPISFDKILRGLIARDLSFTKTSPSSVGPALSVAGAHRYMVSSAAFGTDLKAKDGRYQLEQGGGGTVLTARLPSRSVWQQDALSDAQRVNRLFGFRPDLETSAAPPSDVKGNPSDPTSLQAKGVDIRFKLRSTIAVFRYLGQLSAEVTRKSDAYIPYVLSSPVFYPLRPDPSERGVCDDQMVGYFNAVDLMEAVEAFCGSGPVGKPDLDGLERRVINRQRLPAGDRPPTLESPHLVFLLCLGGLRENEIPYASVDRGAVLYWLPSDRGSGKIPVCRTESLEMDNRSAETLAILGQLLALNRKAEKVRTGQTIRLVQ